jgi:hypothetical protein
MWMTFVSGTVPTTYYFHPQDSFLVVRLHNYSVKCLALGCTVLFGLLRLLRNDRIPVCTSGYFSR